MANQTASHTFDVIVPEACLPAFQQAIARQVLHSRYARVWMKLSDIIDGDFFSQYIKTGDIAMRSEGRPGIDQVCSLQDGILKLEVNKANFERMGLEGKPIANEGRKHVKARFAIEMNLRLPSMVKGKSGFERIVWAFRNVLNHSMTWLFYDLKAPTDGTGPIAYHSPLIRDLQPSINQLTDAITPRFPDKMDEDDYLLATELLEWVTMLAASSPRLQRGDDLDPYLGRYGGPDVAGDGNISRDVSIASVAIFQWRGFLHATFVSKVFLAALKACGDDWFACSAASFSGEAYTILKSEERTMIWEYMD